MVFRLFVPRAVCLAFSLLLGVAADHPATAKEKDDSTGRGSRGAKEPATTSLRCEKKLGHDLGGVPVCVAQNDNSVPVFRFYNQRFDAHMFAGVNTANGQKLEGIAFRLFPNEPVAGTVALYRLLGLDLGHALSVPGPFVDDELLLEGWKVEGVMGTVATWQLPGTVPLVAFKKPNGRFFYSISKDEGIRAGFAYFKDVGFVIPPRAPTVRAGLSPNEGFTAEKLRVIDNARRAGVGAALMPPTKVQSTQCSQVLW